MTKANWLLSRLLLPAGMLPRIISHGDLRHNEQVRKQIGNIGFEYMLLVDQDPAKVNASPIGGKIKSVHAPLPAFSHSAIGDNKYFIEFMTNWIYGPTRFPVDPYFVAEKTITFAKNVGAKVAVFHTYHFDQKNIPEYLTFLSELEKKYKIIPGIEHEGSYIDAYSNYIHEDWTKDPVELINFLDKIYQAKKFMICYDTCSQISNNLPVLDIKKIFNRVAVIHLADSVPGQDLSLEIASPGDIELVNFLYEKKWGGLINAEVNGAIGFWEELVGKIYGASALLGFPILKNVGIRNAQRHQQNSCKFLLTNFS